MTMTCLRAAAAAAILMLGSQCAFAGDDLDPASLKIVHDYTLTLPKVTAYNAATIALRNAEAHDAGLKAEEEAASDEHTKTIGDEFAKVAHHPRILAFYTRRGLTAQDVILIPLTLMSACMVVQYPSAAPKLADQTSPAQVRFCKQNMAALKTMKLFGN